MSLNLPQPLSAYFAADRGDDAEALARCFTDDAVVTDEGHTYTGLAAIKRWRAAAQAKYTYTSEPFALTKEGGKAIVTSKLKGNFPGSPVDLRYIFELEGEKISSLEIVP
jgi:hypothetical protein